MIRSFSSIAASIPMATASCRRETRGRGKGKVSSVGQRHLPTTSPLSSAASSRRCLHPSCSFRPASIHSGGPRCAREAREGSTNLTDSQVAEASDLLCLVEGVGSHLHSSHPRHVGVHLNEEVLGNLDVCRGSVTPVSIEPEREEERTRKGGGGDRGQLSLAKEQRELKGGD